MIKLIRLDNDKILKRLAFIKSSDTFNNKTENPINSYSSYLLELKQLEKLLINPFIKEEDKWLYLELI